MIDESMATAKLIAGLLVALVCIIGIHHMYMSRAAPIYWKPTWPWRAGKSTSAKKPPRNVRPENGSGSVSEQPEANVTPQAAADYKPLNMPCPGIFLPAEKLLETDWMATLQQFLSGLRTKRVNFVTANSQYTDELLNWVISVHVSINPPLQNVLVLALDSELYDLLHGRKIPCVFIPAAMMVTQSQDKDQHFESVWMIRLGLLRVLNWLGFDAAMYDADALVLKNPQPLFENHVTDIVASMATSWPPNLGRKWGFTLCSGVLFFRSNKRTEEYWETLSKNDFLPSIRKFDDQARVNHGLNMLNVTWSSEPKQDLKSGKPVVGTCRNNMTVTVLPRIMVCRHCQLSKSSQYFIWHNMSGKNQASKITQAKLIHHWFLRSDWKTVSNIHLGLTGRDWLKLITD